ncbi:hypothetical protein B0H15DRAFT_298383 [Mycena belliarum]|uniref:Uncharacterized protein n=1 Tax=Mycena belliarum TaxID=1033014 RepID=A0AAD6XRJ4_9AGAR|nr:hypothetical protein B0H15DRAFT_298383 [Mycena belliae]
MHRPPSILRDCRWRCRHRGKLLWFQATEAPLGAIFGDTPGRVARHLALAAGSEYISNFGICESAEIEWPRARASKRARTSTSAARSDGVPPTASGQPKSNSRLVHKAAVERAILLHDLDTLNNKRAAFKWWRSHSEQELSKISDEISSGKRIIGSRRLLSWRRTAILELLRARTVDIFASSESRLLTLPAESKHSEDKARGCVKRDMDESVLRKSRLLLICSSSSRPQSRTSSHHANRRRASPMPLAHSRTRSKTLATSALDARNAVDARSTAFCTTLSKTSPAPSAASAVRTSRKLRRVPHHTRGRPRIRRRRRPHTVRASRASADRPRAATRRDVPSVRAGRTAGRRHMRTLGRPFAATSRPHARCQLALGSSPAAILAAVPAARRHPALRAVRIPARIASWDPDRPWMHARPAPCAPSVHDSLTARAADGCDGAHEP